MTKLVHVERCDGIAIVRIQNSPVNALSAQVRGDLYNALQSLSKEEAIVGIVLAGSGRGFSGGADIGEFGGPAGSFRAGEDPARVTALIEEIDKPVVAAIHGFALGGGLELAMGCHARVASAQARLGLPEISLGVIPGAGGTQRLPRLVGVSKALEMMLSGRPINGKEAALIGLVELVVDDDPVSSAIRLIKNRQAGDGVGHATRFMQVPGAGKDNQAEIEKARSRATSMGAKSKAALKVIECVAASVGQSFDEGMALEREAFSQCLESPESAALRHVFFAERAAGKLDTPGASGVGKISTVGVVGGGTMGRGIAMSFANAGIPVRLLELTEQKANTAVEAIRLEYQRQMDRGKLKAAEAAGRSALIQAARNEGEIGLCDLVVEAVFEDMQIKLEMAQRLGRACRDGAIIASNTSTLDIDRLAQASGRPADFVGLHFFSPANIMRLVEVVRGKGTSANTLATVVEVVKRIAKVPVITGVCWGFVGNRMLEPYLREVESLLLEGASPSQIDHAIEGFGMAMGPCRMMDLAGVDVVAKVVEEQAKEGRLPEDPLYRIVSRHLASVGRHGQKTGEGFYRYEGRVAADDVDTHSLVQAMAARHDVKQRQDISSEEIVERCMLPLINEGYRLLAEGIASRSSDIDVVWLTGYGFPQALGGPMYHGERLGAAHLLKRLSHYGSTQGNIWNYWTPAAMLAAHAGGNP
ncbi:3-hydroxyacyl-CoA dehydrogenase NAD-binding domain-containing protein [Alicycliphilus denitrificans]|uniref:3-hydroxybutyryl-CoA epimerase n=1 Tax=Alicycliphilus denitrificans (strain DSM 14773 / CIP 107495 / K601) TaxID=596154 RepID=F4G7P8_ALIDK|nr:3-hydroxyacyl-CoA dehydrogenase NAD-binding domain-containing protein [Alicycliphilus denitrificans]AEB86645.1 3-hydroxybutyryl-CoA epimerase [Alicycliphilus denitrificans K601]